MGRRHPNGFLTPHIIQSREAADWLHFVWVYFALEGSVPVCRSDALGRERGGGPHSYTQRRGEVTAL